jgi:cobalt/nickel transport system permease protein
LAPQIKVAGTFIFVVAVAITPREAFAAFAVHGLIIVAVAGLARVPPRFLLVRLLGILPFILFAFFLPFLGSGDEVTFWGLSLSQEGLLAAWNIVAKATLGASASILLVATTEVPAILRGLSTLRVPTLLVSVTGFMVRYLELIVEELGRMRVAMVSRGHDARWLWQVRPIATGAGAMFIRSYERGERVHQAMVSRGFTGVMPTLEDTRAQASTWVAGLAVPGIALLAALTAVVMS